MKFYRIDYIDQYVGHIVDWAGSMAEAKKIISGIKKDAIESAKLQAQKNSEYYGHKIKYQNEITIDFDSFEISKQLIPADKKGLLIWLRANIETNNG